MLFNFNQVFAKQFSFILSNRLNNLKYNARFRNSSSQQTKPETNESNSSSVANQIENDSNQSLQQSEKTEVKRESYEVSLTQEKTVIDNDTIWEYNANEQSGYQTFRRFTSRKGIPVDFVITLTKKYDLSFTGFKRMLKRHVEERERNTQMYIPARHGILGPNLATAHFITFRGGKVRFQHLGDNWINHCERLPNRFNKEFILTAVDATGCKLRYEALDNLVGLSYLQELNLTGNKYIDDWFCDKMGRIFRNSTSLATLDLTDTLVTNRGIETLHRIKSLRKLIIKGTKAANYPFLELLILLFNDTNPECEIIY